jgi:hypothetical protein
MLSGSIPLSAQLADHLKAAVDAAVAEYFVYDYFAGIHFQTNPFDTVYISRLMPDAIAAADLDRIREFSHVRDVSDSIYFADHWDD